MNNFTIYVPDNSSAPLSVRKVRKYIRDEITQAAQQNIEETETAIIPSKYNLHEHGNSILRMRFEVSFGKTR